MIENLQLLHPGRECYLVLAMRGPTKRAAAVLGSGLILPSQMISNVQSIV
jgi:hypothetical protein